MIIYLCVNDVKYNKYAVSLLEAFQERYFKRQILNIKLFSDRSKKIICFIISS